MFFPQPVSHKLFVMQQNGTIWACLWRVIMSLHPIQSSFPLRGCLVFGARPNSSVSVSEWAPALWRYWTQIQMARGNEGAPDKVVGGFAIFGFSLVFISFHVCCSFLAVIFWSFILFIIVLLLIIVCHYLSFVMLCYSVGTLFTSSYMFWLDDSSLPVFLHEFALCWSVLIRKKITNVNWNRRKTDRNEMNNEGKWK